MAHGARSKRGWLARRTCLLPALELAAAAALAAAALRLALSPAKPQDPLYHSFADSRSLWRLANAANVLSSGAWAAPTVSGLWALWRQSRQRQQRRQRSRGRGAARRAPPEGVEAACLAGGFAASLGTAAASAYYHLQPSNARLVWDRLGIILSFACFAAATLAERRGDAAALAVLPLLVAAGAGSVAWWAAGEAAGAGDLRPYLFMQDLLVLCCAYHVTALPSLRLPPGWPDVTCRCMLASLATYTVAVVAERADAALFRATGGMLSGHTLKHLLIAAATWPMVAAVRARGRRGAPG